MRLPVVTNLLAYQCAWFACVLGAAAQRPLVGVVVVLATLAWHLRRAHAPARELRLIAIAVAAGTVFESLLVATGWVRMPESGLLGVTPWWMVALWASFATTLNVSLRPLREHVLLGAVAGAVAGPLAYYAGSRLGALEWVELLPGLALVGLGWALFTPLLLHAARRHDGFATR